MVETSSRQPLTPLHWSLWLAAGVVFGLTVGFAVGLAKPHARR